MAQYLVNALSLGSFYALVALGIALIFGVMGLVNFAHGELIMIGGYALLAFHPLPFPMVATLTILVVAACALAMERAAFRPVRGASGETMLMTSFAVSTFLQGSALLVEGADPRTVDLLPGIGTSVDIAGLTIGKLDIATIAVTLLLLAALASFMRYAPVGLQMRAAAEDFRMARALGVRANQVIATAFSISGGLAAIAAIILVARSGTLTPSIGLAPVLVGFVATVLGGLGRLWAAVLGAYVLALVTILLQAYLPTGIEPYRDALVYMAVILILILRPHGIAGRAGAVRV